MNYDAATGRHEGFPDHTRGQDLLAGHPEIGSAVIGIPAAEATKIVMNAAASRTPITERAVVDLSQGDHGLSFGAQQHIVEAVQPAGDMPPAVPGVIEGGMDTAGLPPMEGPTSRQ